MFDNFLPILDAESLPFYPLVLKLVVCAFEEEKRFRYPQLLSVRIFRIETFHSKERAKQFQSGLSGLHSAFQAIVSQRIIKNITRNCRDLWISPVEHIQCNFWGTVKTVKEKICTSFPISSGMVAHLVWEHQECPVQLKQIQKQVQWLRATLAKAGDLQDSNCTALLRN